MFKSVVDHFEMNPINYHDELISGFEGSYFLSMAVMANRITAIV